MTQKALSVFTHLRLDADGSSSVTADAIKGAIVCEIGPAKGHDFVIDEKFLDDTVKFMKGKKIKVRLEHPAEGENGKVLSLVGSAANFYRDGDKVRADIQLFDVPAKKTLLTLAEQAGEFFGMSLDFLGKYGRKLASGMHEMTVKVIRAVDFVGEPAATSKLLQTSVDSKRNGMNVTLSAELIKKFGLEKLDEEAAAAELQKRLSKLQKLEEEKEKEMEAEEPKTMAEHMARLKAHLEAGDGSDEHKEKTMGYMEAMEAAMDVPADDKKKEELDDKEEDKDGKMSRKDVAAIVDGAIARLSTKLLSKIGGSAPRISAPRVENTDDEIVLSAKQTAECKRLGTKPEDFIANLKKFGQTPVMV